MFYVRDRFRWQQEQPARNGEPGPGGYGPPDDDELLAFPWIGEGPDPMRGG